MGGWAGDNFWVGGARLAYSFSAGLLVYRAGWRWKNKLGFIGLALLLSLAFLMPWSAWNWLTESLVVLFYFPLLVALGAGAQLSPRMKTFCDFSGRLSYPLYMSHYWAMWIFGHYLASEKPAVDTVVWVMVLGTIFLIAFAYGVMALYDVPVRNYLTNRWKKKATLSNEKKESTDALR